MSEATPIFVPGLLCTDWLFAHQRRALADRAWGGDALVADTLSHDSITAMAKAALAQAGGQIVPIGLSMGGYVALEMARLAPERVAGMALLSTNCRQDTDAQRSYRLQAINLAAQDGFRGVTRQLLGKFLSPAAIANTALVDGVLAMAADVGRTVFAQQQRAILGRRAQHDTIASFRAPLLVLCGKTDSLTPPDLSVEMAALAPQADLRLLDNVGHLSTLEAPEACSAAIVDLIMAVRSAA